MSFTVTRFQPIKHVAKILDQSHSSSTIPETCKISANSSMLFWQLVVLQHITEAIYIVFSFNLASICIECLVEWGFLKF